MKRTRLALIGALATVAMAELWHGPLGQADEFETSVERKARFALDLYEFPQVQARLAETPLSRQLILSGPADDFQRRSLLELMEQLPGVNEVRWDPESPIMPFSPGPARP